MAASPRERRELSAVIAISCAIGALAGLAVAEDAARGLLQGGLSGALVSLAARTTGLFVERSGLHRWPFGAYLMTGSLLTALAIVGSIAAASIPWALTEGVGDLRSYVLPFAVASVASLAFTAWFSLDRLLGGDVLLGLLIGRYHRPRVEERVFLFADLVGSTALAERLGELRFHDLLSRLWNDVSGPVQRHGGTVHRYVGDEIEVTWTLERGRGQCLRCARAILDTLAEARPQYRREFGTEACLRLALHAGPVVVGELGTLKREIAYSGDTLNTTARIEGVAKELDRDIVVSGDLLHLTGVPEGLLAEPLGRRRLRGREREVELFAIEAVATGYVGAMAAKRVLVVTTTVPDERVRERLREQIPEDAEVRVVAPATEVSTLDWLTNAEDDARAQAARAAEQTAGALQDESRVEVDRTGQNTDAAENVRDALRQFPADEIVVVTSPGVNESWLEEEAVREALEASGVPVRRLEA
jgi:adenylate cyclase